MKSNQLSKLPILLLHEEQDQLATVAGAKRVTVAVSSADAEFRLYSTSRHEPISELDRQRLCRDILR